MCDIPPPPPRVPLPLPMVPRPLLGTLVHAAPRTGRGWSQVLGVGGARFHPSPAVDKTELKSQLGRVGVGAQRLQQGAGAVLSPASSQRERVLSFPSWQWLFVLSMAGSLGTTGTQKRLGERAEPSVTVRAHGGRAFSFPLGRFGFGVFFLLCRERGKWGGHCCQGGGPHSGLHLLEVQM